MGRRLRRDATESPTTPTARRDPTQDFSLRRKKSALMLIVEMRPARYLPYITRNEQRATAAAAVAVNTHLVACACANCCTACTPTVPGAPRSDNRSLWSRGELLPSAQRRTAPARGGARLLIWAPLPARLKNERDKGVTPGPLAPPPALLCAGRVESNNMIATPAEKPAKVTRREAK
ncbi:hypothetical protein EVAR_2465_1 [Eumeta japonica]|uniref:Uncharacterized protein n=1 Tax=Eumeta variegata TaxID=151549 RepID=A0A4C1SR88_EUMVA|nr:hypothetical protein EVAR_2465_1 [Eumeta japonica]